MLNVAVKFSSSRQQDNVIISLIFYDIVSLKYNKNLLVAQHNKCLQVYYIIDK